jgi:hypothetical protein
MARQAGHRRFRRIARPDTSRSTSSRIVKNDSTAPQATSGALATIAIRKPCRNTSGCNCASPIRPASGRIAATNSSDAARATASLTPLANPRVPRVRRRQHGRGERRHHPSATIGHARPNPSR